MRIDKAKELIITLQEYVSVYEGYKPTNIKQEAIKLYAELENVGKVAKELNEKGYRKDGRPVAGKVRKVKLESNDVTEIIDSNIDDGDTLHEIVKKALKRNRRKIS
ncbi:hypothetical protein [Paucisalibacillus globulus]|uniref:hypothetical protein n=1 Tax=Paucisalibacillus globulus TaxID=351095 RepID=UPI00056AD745|nr:hypothetical protein [Paucisalibacillus globulus]